MFKKTGLNALMVLVLVVAVAPPTVQATDYLTIGEAINQAGRQRMLTQRIIKAYTMMGLDVNPYAAADQLRDAVTLFEKQLANLEAFAPSDKIRARLGEVEVRWAPFKELATAPVKREQALEVRKRGNHTLAIAHQVVLDLQEAAGTAAGRLVNISGRQRMLSQRLAGLYMLKAWELEDGTLESDYATATQEFDIALKELIAAPENTAAISAELKQVNGHWKLFQHSAKLREGEYIPFMIARSSDRILKMMNDVTGLYAVVADSAADK